MPEYLGWLSKTPAFVELCSKFSEGTTNRVRLKEDRFYHIEIPLPPLNEQQRIVGRVEELAAKVQEAHGLHRGVGRDARGMLLSAYDKIAADAPRLPMAEVAPLIRRPVVVDPLGEYDEIGIRSFGKGTFHKPPVSGLELGSKRIFEIRTGDLLFNIVFAWEGAVAVAGPNDDQRVGSHRFLTCVPLSGVATAPFLAFHFLTAEGLDQLGKASPGGAGRNRTLGIKALDGIRVPVPPIEQQLWFDSLQQKVSQITTIRAAISAELDALLPSILGKAFRGEL